MEAFQSGQTEAVGAIEEHGQAGFESDQRRLTGGDEPEEQFALAMWQHRAQIAAD